MTFASNLLDHICAEANLAYFRYEAGTGHFVLSNNWNTLHGTNLPAHATQEDLLSCYDSNQANQLQELLAAAFQSREDFSLNINASQQAGPFQISVKWVAAAADAASELIGVVTARSSEAIASIEGSRTKAERENQRYDIAIRGATVGLWDWDVENDTLYWSERMRTIFGVADPSYEPTYAGFIEYVHPDDRERVDAAVNAHIQARKPYKVDYRVVQDSGRVRWIHARGEAVFDDAGNPTRMAGSVDDITETKRLRDQQGAAAKFQDLVFSKISDLIFVKDSEFRIVQANPAFLNLYPPEIRDTVIGTTTFEEYDDQQREEFVAEDRRAFEQGQSETEETIDFPDGRRRTIWTKKTRFVDEHNDAYILGVARDISEIEIARKALESANQELEEFSYRVSHDLRSPLVSSTRLLELAKEDLANGNSDAAAKLLDTARDSLGRLSLLAEHILDISRVKQAELDSERIDIKALVAEVWSRYAAVAMEKGIKLNTQINIESDIFSDPYGLNLLLDNLISNAIKYADPETADAEVNLHVNVNRQLIRIEVADNGLGIPSEYRDKLFNMFARFHPKAAKGTGLGLYMVSKWVERLGGTISAEPYPHKGTCFKVEIPHIRA